MLKKIFMFVICLTILFSLQGVCFAAGAGTLKGDAWSSPFIDTTDLTTTKVQELDNSNLKVFVNNEKLISKNPLIFNGEIIIPIRLITDLLHCNVPIKLISQAFGVNIVYDTNTKSIYIETKFIQNGDMSGNRDSMTNLSKIIAEQQRNAVK
jgi:hypothetical protein